MRLRDYVEIARQRMVVVVAVIVVTMVAAIGLLLLQSPVYTANVRLRTLPAAPGSAATSIVQAQAIQGDVATEAQLVRSSKVATEVAKALAMPGNPDDLLAKLSVAPVLDTTVLQIFAVGANAQDAINLANSFSEKYLEVRRKTLTEDLDAETKTQTERLKSSLDRVQQIEQALAATPPGSAAAAAAQAERDQIIADLVVTRSKVDALADRAAIAAGFGEIIQTATSANASRSQSLPRAAVFGLLLGIPLAFAAVLVLDGLSNDVRTRQDVDRLTGADLIGVIPLDSDWNDPAVPRLVTSSDPLSPAAEAYRSLSFTLARYAEVAGATSLLVTSPGDGDGKTAAVANLAVAAADTGRPTRVVEADLRHPRLHTFFDARLAPGLADVLAGEVALEDAFVQLGHGLDFLPAGRASERPDLLMARGDLGPILSGVPRGVSQDRLPGRPLKARAGGGATPGLVLVDSAAILGAGEVARLAAEADAVVLVVRAHATSKQALSAAAEQIRRVGGTLLGVVLIGVRSVAESGLPEEARIPVGASASRTGNGARDD